MGRRDVDGGCPDGAGSQLANGYTFGSGAGISSDGLADVELEDCSFADNLADGDGGGIAVNDVALTVTRCSFDGNVAGGIAGGGLYASLSLVTLLDSSFTNNQVVYFGGGLYLYEGESTITGCEVTTNTAGLIGGGIRFYSVDVGTYSLENSLVTGNSPDDISTPPTATAFRYPRKRSAIIPPKNGVK